MTHNPQRLLPQLTELGEHLNIPQGRRTLEQWAMAIQHELRRRLAAGEPMPPSSQGSTLMKQTEIPALNVQVALELLRVDLFHDQSQTWILKSTIRHGRDPVHEILRLARLYQRLEIYLATQSEGPYEAYTGVRIKYRDIVLAAAKRTIYPERKAIAAPVKAPKAPIPKAEKPAASPASSATAEGTSGSKQPRGRAGAARGTQPETTRKPRKTTFGVVPKST